DKEAFDQSIQLAAGWLANARPRNNDDRGWRLLGLAWSGKDKGASQKAMQELLATQRTDGGWSDLDSMESSAYATGKALYALRNRGHPGTRCSVLAWGPVPAQNTARGRLVVREDACHGSPAILRRRFSPQLRSMDIGGRFRLGDAGASSSATAPNH